MFIILRSSSVAAFVMFACFISPHAIGADYPVKAIRFIVPFPPGGGTDIGTRIIAAKLSERFGQQVIADNRGGAGYAADTLAESPFAGSGVVAPVI